MRSLSVSYIKWTGRFFYGKKTKKTCRFLAERNMSDITGAGFYHNTDAANAPGKPHLWKGRGAGSTEHNRQCSIRKIKKISYQDRQRHKVETVRMRMKKLR